MIFSLICGLLLTYLEDVSAVAFALWKVAVIEITNIALIFNILVAVDEFAGNNAVKNLEKDWDVVSWFPNWKIWLREVPI